MKAHHLSTAHPPAPRRGRLGGESRGTSSSVSQSSPFQAGWGGFGGQGESYVAAPLVERWALQNPAEGRRSSMGTCCLSAGGYSTI